MLDLQVFQAPDRDAVDGATFRQSTVSEALHEARVGAAVDGGQTPAGNLSTQGLGGSAKGGVVAGRGAQEDAD